MMYLRSFHLLPLVVLAVVPWAMAADGGDLFNTPTTSSTYARVQYANQANLTRRFGISRDPTIQYISFDELYNKYNKGGGSKFSKSGAVQEPSTSQTTVIPADEKMDIQWHDDAPNLRNGWTVERLPSEVSPSKTRVKATSSAAFNKGIDQVYAYSNAYSGQFGKEAAYSTAKPAVAPGEYAHAIEDEQHDHVGAGSDLKSNAVVMETSWTDVDDEEHLTTSTVNERSDAISSSMAPKTFTAPPLRAKTDGVQSAWRPFAGPTVPPTTVSPKSKRVLKTARPPAAPQTMEKNDSEDDVLFYGEAQKAASRRPSPGPLPVLPINPNVHRPGPPNVFSQPPFVVRPNNDAGQLWLMPNAADNEVTPGGSSPTPRPFSGRPDERVKFAPPTFLHSNQHPIVIPPPGDRFQQGPLSGDRFQQGPSSGDRFQQGPSSGDRFQQAPSFGDRFQQGPPPGDRFQQSPPPGDRFQQSPPPGDRFQQSPPPGDRFQQSPPPGDRFQQSPPPGDRFQQGSTAGDRFHLSPPPTVGQWSNVNPHFPLSRPSGPVGVAPQLLNPSGQVRPRPQEPERRPIQIPLPVPRPTGPLGSSPDNPLPGPPIALPGIPAFNMHGNGRPNDRDVSERPQRFPPGPPQHFPTVHLPDRNDGPQGPADNFVRGPQQPPFNPNGPPPPPFNPNGPPPPPFNPNGQRPNFNRPLPPPPQGAPSTTSIIKSFFSRFFPFARSMDLDGIPVVDINQLTNNGTNMTALDDAPPEVVAHLLKLSSNATSSNDEGDGTTSATSTGNPSNATELSF